MKIITISFIILLSACTQNIDGINYQELEPIFREDIAVQTQTLLSLGFYQLKRSKDADFERFEKFDTKSKAIQVPIDERITIYDSGQITYWTRGEEQIDKISEQAVKTMKLLNFQMSSVKEINGETYRKFEYTDKIFFFGEHNLMVIPKI